MALNYDSVQKLLYLTVIYVRRILNAELRVLRVRIYKKTF